MLFETPPGTSRAGSVCLSIPAFTSSPWGKGLKFLVKLKLWVSLLIFQTHLAAKVRQLDTAQAGLGAGALGLNSLFLTKEKRAAPPSPARPKMDKFLP